MLYAARRDTNTYVGAEKEKKNDWKIERCS